MRLKIGNNKYFLCNQYSGAVNIVNSSWWDNLGLDSMFNNPDGAIACNENGYKSLLKNKKITREEFDLLEEMGYFLNLRKKEEYRKKINHFTETKMKTRPTTFFIAPHLSCPLDCVYCFEKQDRSSGQKKKSRLTENDIRYIDNFIDKYRMLKEIPPDKISLVLFGGEPLAPELKTFNRQIIDLAIARGYFLDIATSGVFLDQKYLDLIVKNRQIIREIDITIDGPQKVHDRLRPLHNRGPSYKLIKQNVDRLLEKNIRVMVKTNFGKDTIENIELFIKDMIKYGWFDHDYFIYTTNAVRSFGKTDTAGQKSSEDFLTAKLVELFKKHSYSRLLPKLRFEGLKLTDYIANSFQLLTYKNQEGKLENKFDAYPKYASCHPNDGTSIYISYDGSAYTCNWMLGKHHLSVGNIFDNNKELQKNLSKYQKSVINRTKCFDCDILTLCGGGCLIDREEITDYQKKCYHYNYLVISGFIKKCVRNKWFNTDLKGKNIFTFRKSFDFDYCYENRVERK